MFVWGVGTSNIFEDGWNWPESRSAAVLAVGTIVIPAVDGFVNSQRMEQWNDKARSFNNFCPECSITNVVLEKILVKKTHHG